MESKKYYSPREAADFLGVKTATLYAYVSRGLIRPIRADSGKASLYASEDLEILRSRKLARSGHGPSAGAALSFGEPVLETELFRAGKSALYYRGRDVVELCTKGARFENVAEFLWSGVWIEAPIEWGRPTQESEAISRGDSVPTLLSRMRKVVANAAWDEDASQGALPEAANIAARSLLLRLARVISECSARRFYSTSVPVARLLAAVSPRRNAEEALNQVLILVAEHELNASTFAARVAASNGAGLLSCLEAAMATHSGLRQGLTPRLLEQRLASLKTNRDIDKHIDEARYGRIELLGFGHRLYPQGDPRGRYLLDLAHSSGLAPSERARLDYLCARVKEVFKEEPNVDLGLVALSRSLALPPDFPAAVFCLGRVAGWVAHVLEQSRSSIHIRPRARYTGP